MNTKLLKEKILDLAMRGKLVSQNPNDEPATELLKRIEKEKQKLIKEKKIKKQKPLPPITNEEIPFEIPSSWKWVRLGQIINFNIGKTPPRKDKRNWEEDYLWVSISDMTKNKLITETKERVSEYAYLNTFKKNIIPKETLLMSFKLTIGNVSILKKNAFHNEAIISIFPYINEEYIIRNFLLEFLPLLSNLGNTKTAIKGKTLNTTSINNILIPLPPLNEQKRIVEKIESLFSLIDQIDEKKELLFKTIDLTQEKILDLAMRGKLVSQDPNDEPAKELLKRIEKEKQKLIKEKKIKKQKPLPPITPEEIPFKIPSSWKWVQLNDLTSKIHYGYTASAKHNSFDIKLLRITDVQNNNVCWETVPTCEIKNIDFIKYKLGLNDILIARTGGTVGKSYLISKQPPKAVFASYMIRLVTSKNISADFLRFFLDSSIYWSQIKNKKTGTGQPNINATSLKTFTLPLPPLNEQKRIVEKIESSFKLIEKIKNNLIKNISLIC
ncbi:restriction endonuclease subunit S [Candidatus Woesearchaeota archaeon]|nr:MAG: restriction endonuclease subunit S [Candidatus Woesearchaeota archaeon]